MPVWLKILLPVATISALAASSIRLLFFREAGRRRMLPWVRPLLKRVINPRVLRAAARGETSWGIVHHAGRRSGSLYRTPVEAHRIDGGAVIGLPYGPVTDWCRNVLAAGHCTLTLNGDDLVLTAPVVVSTSSVESQVPMTVARRWRRQGIAHVLTLTSEPRGERDREHAPAEAGAR